MQQNFEKALKEKGATLVGFADIRELPEQMRKSYRCGVIIGVALNKEVVKGIPTGPHPDYEQEYDSVSALLDEIAVFAENWLIENGQEAFALTSKTAPYNRETCRTDLPHKTVARLAGLGWVGKSALLITPEYGSAVRFATVLTNAPFECAQEAFPNRCGSCQKCARACPGQAISGKKWEQGVSRDELVSTAKCQEMFRVRSLQSGQHNGTCGICIAACPYTQRYFNKA